jgi:hypothetical protein
VYLRALVDPSLLSTLVALERLARHSLLAHAKGKAGALATIFSEAREGGASDEAPGSMLEMIGGVEQQEG